MKELPCILWEIKSYCDGIYESYREEQENELNGIPINKGGTVMVN